MLKDKQIEFFVWSDEQLIGSVKELNYRTAEQKARVLARYLNRKTYSVSTSSVPGKRIVAFGHTGLINKPKHASVFHSIMRHLTRGTI